jgi:hypothetical protein
MDQVAPPSAPGAFLSQLAVRSSVLAWTPIPSVTVLVQFEAVVTVLGQRWGRNGEREDQSAPRLAAQTTWHSPAPLTSSVSR